jgi:hypothetical protein
MLIKYVGCNYVLKDEAEYIYKVKTYGDDCYRAVKKAEAAAQQEKEHNLF